MPPAQLQNQTKNWKPVGEGKASDESGRGGVEEIATGRTNLCRLVRRLARGKKENFRKQRCRMFGSIMDEQRQGCVSGSDEVGDHLYSLLNGEGRFRNASCFPASRFSVLYNRRRRKESLLGQNGSGVSFARFLNFLQTHQKYHF